MAMLSPMQLQDKKLEKLLDKQWDWDNYGIASHRELLERGVFGGKYRSVQTHASKKRNGEYAELKTPKTRYNLSYADKPHLSIEVPKLIYDYVDLPEGETLQRW